MTQELPPSGALSINTNGTIPVRLEGGFIHVDLKSMRSQHFWRHLSQGLTMHVLGAHEAIIQTVTPYVVDGDTREIIFPLPQHMEPNSKIQFMQHDEPISEFTIENDLLKPTANHPIFQLTVPETRGLSKHLNPATLIPYSRKARMGYDPAIHAPITDLHTHVSSQLRAGDLFAISLKLDQEAKEKGEYVTYPVELLDKLGVPATDNQDQHRVLSYEFKPMQDQNLDCERGQPGNKNAPRNYYMGVRLQDLTEAQRGAVIAAMDAGEDQMKSFQQVEKDIYRHMSPLTRNPRLTKPLLRKIAQDYAAQGIEHAELATSSLLNPTWFAQMVEAVDEIEHGTKRPDGHRNNDAITVGPDKKPFSMRFFVGLPRKMGPTDTLRALEKTKILARHPYICGIDLMGSETNKTSDFHWALSNIAMWARTSENSRLNPNDGWDFKEDFIIRVHAGETAKNPQNVGDAVRIAHEHKVRVRVGHAQSESLTDDEWAMLREMHAEEGKFDEKKREQNPHDWFGFEKCPDSNQFYRMQPLVHQVVIKRHADVSHCVLGQDGNGMVHTDPTQTAFSALATGMTLDDLASMRKYEEGYISRTRAREARKTKAFNALYPGGFEDFLDEYKSFDADAEIARKFANKTEILIGGASRSSWVKLAEDGDKLSPTYIRQMVKILVKVLNPKTTSFLLGRVHTAGASKILDQEVKRYNIAHSTNKFAVKELYGHQASAEIPTGELAETVCGIATIKGGLDAVPDETIDHVRENNGKALFLGGAQFTSEMIQNAQDDPGIPFAAYLPDKSEVATKVKSCTDSDRHILSPEDLVKRILRDVGPNKFFKTVQERDSMLRDSVSITDNHYCDHLLAEVEKEVAQEERAAHATASRRRARGN